MCGPFSFATMRSADPGRPQEASDLSVQHSPLSMLSSQTSRNKTVFNKIVFKAQRDHTPWGSVGHFSKRLLELTGLGLWFGDLREGSRNRVSLWTGYCQEGGLIL